MTSSAHEFDIVMNNGEQRSLSYYKGHPLIQSCAVQFDIESNKTDSVQPYQMVEK